MRRQFPRGCAYTRMVLSIAVSILYITSAAAQDWPMVNGSKERRSWTGPGVRFAPPITKRAPIGVPRGAENLVYYRGILYASSSGDPNMITAVEAATGRILWADSIPRSVAGNDVVPAVDDNNVYFGGQQGTGLFAFNRLTGALRWSRPLGSLYARCPMLDGQYLYIIRDSLRCFDAATGRRIWTVGISATASPVLDETAVYISGDGTIGAFDKLTGAPRWSVTKTTSSYGSLAVDADFLYASFTDTIAAFRKSDGSISWATDCGGRKISHLAGNAIAITDSALCYAYESDSTGNGGIVALDIRTGAPRWSFPFSVEGAFSPTIVDGVVYLSDWSIGQLWGLSLRSGAVVFRDTLANYEFQPVFADGILYVATGNSIVPFVSSTTGFGWNPAPPRRDLSIQAAPNPFTTSTTIYLASPNPASARVSIVDALGRHVATLYDGVISGEAHIEWNTGSTAHPPISSGIYYIVVTTATGIHRAGLLQVK